MDSWSAPDLPSLPGTGRTLAMFDSARQGVSPTAAASMYVCGITPYDATHLGHAATMIAFDLVNRAWRDAGLPVRYVQNVTDIDDPLLERAAHDGEDWVVLGMRETALFREDMEALRILPPTHYVGAVESVPQIAAEVARLLDLGAAYRLDDGTDDVYFDVAAAPRFGYESNLSRPEMLRLAAERGGDPDRPGKRDPLDPVLWRGAREGEPAWPGGPLGPGWLAHRVRGHRPAAAGSDHRGAGRRQRPALPAPRVLCRARRGPHRLPPVRLALRARRHDRPARREDVQEQGQPGVRVPAAGRPGGPDGGTAGVARRPLPYRPAVDR